jgi:hypothetical protein
MALQFVLRHKSIQFPAMWIYIEHTASIGECRKRFRVRDVNHSSPCSNKSYIGRFLIGSAHFLFARLRLVPTCLVRPALTFSYYNLSL